MENEKKILIALRALGVPPHIRGYQYIVWCVGKALEQPNTMNALCKEMYGDLGKQLGIPSARVERCIRTAVAYVFDRPHTKQLNRLFNGPLSMNTGMPTNKQFIATVADYIKSEPEEFWLN